QPVAITDEVTFAAVVDSIHSDTLGVHGGIHVAEKIGALLAKHGESVGRKNSRQNEITFLMIEGLLLGGKHAHGRAAYGNASANSSRFPSSCYHFLSRCWKH